MSNLLEHFGAAYLINLPSRTDRLRGAKKELARAGWTLGPGGVEHYAAKTFTDRAGFPFPGSRGCFHSHFECIQRARKLSKDSVLVMEDDIALPSSIVALAPSIVAKLSATPWDFLYLGHEDTGPIQRATSATTEVEFVPYNGGLRAAHCYVVNSRIFDRLLAHLERVRCGVEGDQEFGPMPIDGAYNIFRRNNSDVRTLIAVPKLCWQRSSRSDNHPKYFDRFGLLRPIVSVLREVKGRTMRLHSK